MDSNVRPPISVKKEINHVYARITVDGDEKEFPTKEQIAASGSGKYLAEAKKK
ncbi:hypothetical protein GCM10027516_33340 [Niabella aquatica]